MAAPYVLVRTKRRLRCPGQPDPRYDPNPNPNPNPPLWGALGLLSRSAGAVLSLRAILKTLHVRAIIRLVHVGTSVLKGLRYSKLQTETKATVGVGVLSSKGVTFVFVFFSGTGSRARVIRLLLCNLTPSCRSSYAI